MIIVSACLAGHKCSWDAKGRLNPEIGDMVARGMAVPVCPEVAGGRAIPRSRAEIKGGSGADVLSGRARVIDENGLDVTDAFLRGAYLALSRAKQCDAREAVLKSRSPSCGLGIIYDGTFTGRLRTGDGVTAALFKREGIICRAV